MQTADQGQTGFSQGAANVRELSSPNAHPHEVCVAQRTPENLDPLLGQRDLRSSPHVAAVHRT